LAELGCRGLLLVGREANLDAARTKDVCVAAFAPLSRVLARSRAIVHHGGFGTTTTALRCGVPALVVPRAFDQVYHGERIAALGAGRSVAWKKLGAGRLAAELRALLAEPSYGEKARALGEALAGEDGVGSAVRRLEALLGPASARATDTPRS
jgi:UDP:flavonoid glycosyltransferase YjiC (YdhE family)